MLPPKQARRLPIGLRKERPSARFFHHRLEKHDVGPPIQMGRDTVIVDLPYPVSHRKRNWCPIFMYAIPVNS
jgi:hypothetical protein